MLPSPYYTEPGITLYCGNSQEILPELPQCGLLLCDPPYGLDWMEGAPNLSLPKQKWDQLPSEELIRLCVLKAEHAIVWGGNYLCNALGSWRTPLV